MVQECPLLRGQYSLGMQPSLVKCSHFEGNAMIGYFDEMRKDSGRNTAFSRRKDCISTLHKGMGSSGTPNSREFRG